MNIQHPNATEPIITRHIPTPDGLTQIVSLLAGWWDCLDWMIEDKGESLEKISDFCWRYVREYPGQEFAAVFNYYLHHYMMNHLAKRHNLANDNYIDTKYVSEKQ
jgi:hypothetical protein